jgi:peptidyl-prolyl cis-trans isomerase D
MQIIQGIRDKGAAIVIAVISLSLIGFILMDAKQGGNNMSAGSASIGKVNGSDIEQTYFSKKIQDIETQEEQQSGQKPTTTRIAQIRDQVWNQVVAEKIFYTEAAKLGIEFTSKELDNILKTDDQSNPLMQDQTMVNPATGRLDMAKVAQALGNIKKATGEQWETINTRIIEPQKLTSVSTKYFALLNASAYYPTWMEERDAKETKSFANISYVEIPYQVITDSTKITDAEVEAYIKSHKGQFKQEEGRMISYVGFSQLPSAADSVKTKAQVEGLRADFTTDPNVKNFIARNASVIPYDSTYEPKARVKSSKLDSILAVPQGTVYGPYVDGGSYVLAKVLGTKPVPDSTRASHILFPVNDPQTGKQIMEEGQAKKMADSILALIKGGADFAALAKQYGTDGTKDKGGDLGYFGFSGPMVPEFNTGAFGKAVGTKEVIYSRYGFHVIEITGEKNMNPGYKIAFMAKDIIASEETINNASNEAIKLSSEKDAKKLDAYIQKNGLQKITVPTLIKENDATIGQMQDARQLVRWVFEAKKGDVSDPMPVGDQFIVATVDKVYKEGTQDVETARPLAENAIREEKKAAQIIAALGTNPTLESAAAKYAKEIKMTAASDSNLTFKSKIIDSIGAEPKLIGAIFNKANLNKVAAPLAGKSGVFVFKVNSIAEKATDPNEDKLQNRAQQTAALRNLAAINWFEGLRKKATIKDNRSKFF